MDYQKYARRIADLKDYQPGDWIPSEILTQDHWVGCAPHDVNYAGFLTEVFRFIENYFLNERETSDKVLCVRREHGIAITVGGESSQILNNRATKAVNLLKKTLVNLDNKVDQRYMTPTEQRRHEQTRLRVQLQVEAQEHSRVKYNSLVEQQEGKSVPQRQTQSITI